MDDNVGAKLKGVLDVRGHESVVDNNEDAVLVGSGDDGADVDQTEGGVAGSLDPDQPRLGGDVLGNVDLNLGREGDLDAVGLCDLGEVAVGAAVDVRDGDDMAAGGQALQDDGSGGAAGGEGQGVASVLEGRDGSLEVVSVGVGGARVLVDAHGLADGRLGKGCGQRNGLNDGAGRRVDGGASVDGKSAEGVDGGRGPHGRGDGVRSHGRRHCCSLVVKRVGKETRIWGRDVRGRSRCAEAFWRGSFFFMQGLLYLIGKKDPLISCLQKDVSERLCHSAHRLMLFVSRLIEKKRKKVYKVEARRPLKRNRKFWLHAKKKNW